MKMMKKNKNFSATDGYKSIHNFLLLFHVKQHELMKSFSTDHNFKRLFLPKKEDKWKTLRIDKTPGLEMISMYSKVQLPPGL